MGMTCAAYVVCSIYEFSDPETSSLCTENRDYMKCRGVIDPTYARDLLPRRGTLVNILSSKHKTPKSWDNIQLQALLQMGNSMSSAEMLSISLSNSSVVVAMILQVKI